MFESHAGAIAGEFMGANEVRLLNDVIFYRGAGTQLASPFHQDLPYFCFDTEQCVSLWMPLVAVEKRSALAFVPGSHHWNKNYTRPKFSPADEHNPDSTHTDYEPLPDIAADPEAFGVVSWDMEPGDCVMFHGLTLHGGSGKLRDDKELKVFCLNWMGEDTRFTNKIGGTEPDFTAICAVNDISEGSPMACDALPLIWSRG